jgi:hypothetical protein
MISSQPAVTNEENEKLALALQKQKDRHRLFQRRFLSNLSKKGLLMETDVRESDRSLVYFIKVHIPWSLMLKYAEDLNFRAPIRVKIEKIFHFFSPIFFKFRQLIIIILQ